DLGGLPVGALFGLEAVGGEGAVVGAGGGDAGAEEVGVGEQVGGHEGAVAVAHDGDAVGVDDTEGGAVVDGRRGGGGELLGVGVVGKLVAFADDGDGGVLEDGVAGEAEGHGREGGDAREAVG